MKFSEQRARSVLGYDNAAIREAVKTGRLVSAVRINGIGIGSSLTAEMAEAQRKKTRLCDFVNNVDRLSGRVEIPSKRERGVAAHVIICTQAGHQIRVEMEESFRCFNIQEKIESSMREKVEANPSKDESSRPLVITVPSFVEIIRMLNEVPDKMDELLESVDDLARTNVGYLLAQRATTVETLQGIAYQLKSECWLPTGVGWRNSFSAGIF